MEWGKKEKGLLYHRIALQKTIQLQLPEQEARAMINMASSLNEKRPDSALWYLDKALVIARMIKQRELCADVYKSKAMLYSELGNYKYAFEAQEAYHNLKDSIFNVKKQQAITSLLTSYELEESEVHVQALELQNQKTVFQRNAGIIIAIAILLITVLMWHNTKKIKKLVNNLRESNEIKDKLFSIIGHDLRSPAGNMVQLLEMMEAGLLTAEQQQSIVVELKKQSEASYNVLNNLLMWGASQLKGIKISPVKFYTKPLIENCFKILENAAHKKEVTLIDETGADLELLADKNHFEFVVRNLLSNAVKFTYQNGTVWLSATRNEKQITFVITDNGMGISKDNKAHLFDGSVGGMYDTDGKKSTGLGLQLCKGFVEQNGGSIWVESELGKGSAFYFTMNIN